MKNKGLAPVQDMDVLLGFSVPEGDLEDLFLILPPSSGLGAADKGKKAATAMTSTSAGAALAFQPPQLPVMAISAVAAAALPPLPLISQSINLVIEDLRGYRCIFKINRNTTFDEHFSQYSRSKQIPSYSVKFLFRDPRVHLSETPNHFGMEDGDVISDVFSAGAYWVTDPLIGHGR